METVHVDLTAVERRVLWHGLLEWGGPARCTEEFARGLGFRGVEDLFREGDRLRAALKNQDPLTPLDWARTLLATETVFISNVLGSGHDWSITTGMSDEDTLRILRALQKKLTRIAVTAIGNGLGTRPAL